MKNIIHTHRKEGKNGESMDRMESQDSNLKHKATNPSGLQQCSDQDDK